MTASNTYTSSPEVADFVDIAFSRDGVDQRTLTGQHARDARMSLNLMFADWATNGVNEFVCEQGTDIPLVVGQANYVVPAQTLAIIAPIFIRNSLATPINFISREDYERIPNKTYNGISTNMFFDRATLTFYIWPRGEFITDSVGYWRMRRIQDVTSASETPDVGYTWFQALASGLAAQLALIYNPGKFSLLAGLAATALKSARDFDRQRSPTVFQLSRI